MRLPLLALFLVYGLQALSEEWFVAPNGNDAWSGKLDAPNAVGTDGPFATIPRARDAMRGGTGARSVKIRNGLYALPQGLALGAADSGSEETPVVWEVYPKEHPVLIGGRRVAGWKPWKNGIYQANVAGQGFRDVAFKQLLCNGERQILARYPNYDPANPVEGGWAYVEGETWPMYAEKPGEDKHTLHVRSSDWRQWARPEEVEVFVFPRYNWWNDILRVKSVDPETRTVTTAKDASYAMRGNDRYYFQGALEELDAPGEWYLDSQAGILYFKPPVPLENASVYAPTSRFIFSLGAGVHHLTLRGLTFECSEGSAVEMHKASHNRMIGCTVRNVGDFGGTGIVVDGGEDNGIIGCDVSRTGRDGISLSGGDHLTLTAAGHFVDNCYIHHPGVYYKQGVGVSLSGVGQRVAHTLIHDTPRFAILFTGNNHTLEFNHLRHLALETEDVGATYCGGRDWTSPRGSIIRYNFIHDVLGFGWNGKWTTPYFAWGIYLDDNSGGVDVVGNIVARCGRALLHGHSARDIHVENNIFVEGGLRQWEFNGWTTKHPFWTDNLPKMMQEYAKVKDRPAWRAMRGMDVPPDKIPDAEGRVMSGNLFTHNIMAWKNDEAKALNVVAFSPERNNFDRNLYWHDGKPLKTGITKPGKTISGNLLPNPDFEGAEPGQFPEAWGWQIHPTAQAKAGLAIEDGRRILRMEAAFNDAKKRDNYPIIATSEFVLKPGASYRLRGRLRSDREQAKASVMVQFYLPAKDGAPAHFWASSPAEAKVGLAWSDFDFAFKVPAKGEKGWHEKMHMFRVRIDWAEKSGVLFAEKLSLEETEPLDEWQSWQEVGGDRHSVVADPKFLAPEKDDYRLAADSPAWSLGFQRIPVEKIGPYESDQRASWPIVEAPGARERLK